MKMRNLTMAILVVGVAQAAHAQFVNGPSVGVIEHGTYAVGANSAVDQYTADGFMLTPGFNYPTVVNPVTLQTTGLVNNFGNLNLNTAPAGQFGGGATSMSLVNFPGGAGIRWGTNWVRDNPANNGFGSYNVSGANARFDAPAGWAGRAGLYLPMRGFAVGLNAYVAASMWMQVEIYNAIGGLMGASLYTARFFHDGAGGRQDGLWMTGPAGAAFSSAYLGAGLANFSGYALVTQAAVVPVGGYAIVRGRYTLLADPDSGADFDMSAGPGTNLPEFGYQPVPEPASMAALGLGVAAVLRRRRSAKNA